jgi:3-hydroxy acid dehydrogenase / malonic semialdehyde reductase
LARSIDKLKGVAKEALSVAQAKQLDIKCHVYRTDVRDASALKGAVSSAAHDLNIDLESGQAFDILINNAGLALGAPALFWEQSIEDINTMIQTNIFGFMAVGHAILNEGGMAKAKRGTIVNVTSTTGLEVPPFPGEAVYHASKACQEAFSNVLRNETVGTNIRILTLRPGVVQTNFHEQRVGYDRSQYNDFMDGIEALVADDVAKAAVLIVNTDERVSIRALDVIPSSQRTLQVFDRDWQKRNASRT